MRRHTEPGGVAKVLRGLVALGLLIFLGFQLVYYLQLGGDDEIAFRGTVTVGCEPFYPYQYENEEGRLSGMGVEVVRQAFHRAGYRVNLVQKEWSTLLEEVKNGRLTATALAYRNPERDQFAKFSRPYFALRQSVFFRLDDYKTVPTDPARLIELAVRDRLRLGRARSYAYPPEVEKAFALPELQDQVVDATHEANDLEHLINGQVDLVMGDELAGTSCLMKNHWMNEIGEVSLDVPARPVHILFGKRRLSQEMLQQVDAALEAMEKDGSTAALVRAYHYPLLLSLLERNFFFDEISVLACGVAAVSGLFLARKEGYNPVGTFLLAAAPAAGGGLLRDLLAGRQPVALVANPSILITVLMLVLASYLLLGLLDLYDPERAEALKQVEVDRHPILICCDALGLACFTVIGVVVAMQHQCEPLWLWGPLLAGATNGGGSLVRDVLRHQPHQSLRTTTLYVEISLIWGLLLSLFLIAYSIHPPHQVRHLQAALLGTMVGVMVTRFAVLRGLRNRGSQLVVGSLLEEGGLGQPVGP